VDDGREDYKIETHYVSIYMDDEDATKIAKREVEASACEAKQDHINAKGLHSNVDGSNDGESHCDETHVDDDCKLIRN